MPLAPSVGKSPARRILLAIVFFVLIAMGYYRIATPQGPLQVWRLEEADYALTMRVISDFHRDYNLRRSDEKEELGALLAYRLQEERGTYGDFLELKKCALSEVDEPPYLMADCTSVFKNGEVHEHFTISRSKDDTHLLSYSIQMGGKETNIPF